MHSEKTTDEYGRTVVTWTLPSDVTVIATVTNRRTGLPLHEGAGTVEVRINNGRLAILKFDHTYAEGAAHELAVAFQNAWGEGQQAGLRAGMEVPE